MSHCPIMCNTPCHKAIATGLLLLLLTVLPSCRFLQGDLAFYDTSKDSNADHVAQNYIETEPEHYEFISYGELIGATTVYGRASGPVRIFTVGETGNFICYFEHTPRFLPGAKPGHRPYLCVKKGYQIVNEFSMAYLTPNYWNREGYIPDMTMELEPFEPFVGFIALMGQAYRAIQPVPYDELGPSELKQTAELRLSMFLSLRDCPEVGIKGELLFGNDGIMYWISRGVQTEETHYIVVGPYAYLPELPAGSERFMLEY